MSSLSGNSITGLLGNHYTLTEQVSQGSQGVLYGESSGEYLIKVLFEHNAENIAIIEKKLRSLYSVALPARFIKPLDIVRFERNGKRYIGYVMKRVKGHMPLNKLLVSSSEMTFGEWYNDFSGGLKRRYYLGYQIAQAFNLLHSRNLAYCDISGNNILVAKNAGINSVCMIDIDNVYAPGELGNNILGTMRYIAPEVIAQQMKPDILTDDYSLAVILFELLRCGHPYIGDFIKNGSPELELAAFRGEFPYIDDADETLNVSSDVLPDNIIFNDTLRALFKNTFVEGRKNRMARALSGEFAIACLEASNALIHCRHCGAWYFPVKELRDEGQSYPCPWCSEGEDKNINSINACILFGKLYPAVDDGTGKGKPQAKLKKWFILENGLNTIPMNYIRRQLTKADYVQSGTGNEIEGNIRSAILIDYDDAQKSCKAKNQSGSDIFVQRQGAMNLITVETGKCVALQDRDQLFFEYPHQTTTFDALVSNGANAKTYQMAHIRIEQQGVVD